MNYSEMFDGFLVKFNSAGSRLWGTYYGGISFDYCNSLDVDGSGNVVIGGSTTSGSQIASPGSFDNTFNGENDGFLAKFNPAGIRQWGTYVGGALYDYFNDLTIDNAGNILATGSVSYTHLTLPTSDPV